MIGCYLTAIVYPLLFIILAVLLYNWGETSIIGMIAAIFVDIAAAIIMVITELATFMYFGILSCFGKPSIITASLIRIELPLK